MVMRDQLGELFVPITADMSGLDRSLQQSRSKLQRASASMRDIGKKMTMGVTLPIVGAGTAFVKMASDHESSFAGVRKTVDATEAEYAELSQTFRDMAKEIPISVNEINRIGEAAGQLGIDKENIADFSRVMADLGVATNMASEDAATALARLANITGMPQTEFDRLGSTVVALGNNLATTESEIVDMSLRLAAAGNQVGLTEHQVLSMAGAMSSVGIRAEAGGTAMSRVMLEMQTHVGNARMELDTLAEVAGMSSSQFAKLFEEDASQAIIAFTKGLGRMNEEGQNVSPVLEELGFDTIRVRDTLLRAAGSGDLFTDALSLGSEAWAENSALTKEAETRYGTFESQVKILRNRLQDMAITIGQPLMHALNNAIEAAEPMISWAEDMAERFADLTPRMQAIILGVAGIAAAAGPALIALGFMLPALAAIGGAIGVVLSPIGLLVAAVVGLGVVIVKNFDEIKDVVGSVVGWVGEKLGVDFVGVFNNARDSIEDTFGEAVSLMMSGDFQGAASNLADTARRFIGEDLIDTFHLLKNEVQRTLSDVADSIASGEFTQAFDILRVRVADILGELSDAIATRLGGGEGETLGSMLTAKISSAADSVVESLGEFRDKVLGWLQNNDVARDIVSMLTGVGGPSLGEILAGKITGATAPALEGLDELTGNIRGWFDSRAKPIPDTMADRIAGEGDISLGEQVKRRIINSYDAVADGLSTLRSNILDWFDLQPEPLPDTMADRLAGGGDVSLGESIGNFIRQAIPKVWNALGELLSGIGDWFRDDQNVQRAIGFVSGFVIKWFARWRLILTEGVPAVTGAVAHFLPSFIEKLDEIYPAVVDAGRTFAEDLVRDLRVAWDSSLASLAEIWTTLSPKISNALDQIQPEINESGRNAVTEFMDTVTEWFDISIPQIGEAIRGKMPETSEAVKQGIRDAAQAGREAAPLIIRGIVDAYIAAAPTVLTTLREIALTWGAFIKEIPGILFVFYVEMARSVMSGVGTALLSFWHLVRRAMDTIAERLGGRWLAMWNAVEDVISGARDNIRGFVDDITGPLRRIIDTAQTALDWLNKVRNAPRAAVGGVGNFFSGLGERFIPGMAEGGIVTSPTLAMIGEKGPEAVVPLSRGGSDSGGLGSEIHLTQNFYGATSPAEQAREQEWALRRIALDGGLR